MCMPLLILSGSKTDNIIELFIILLSVYALSCIGEQFLKQQLK